MDLDRECKVEWKKVLNLYLGEDQFGLSEREARRCRLYALSLEKRLGIPLSAVDEQWLASMAESREPSGDHTIVEHDVELVERPT